MDKIPQDYKDIKELLCQQMALLAEKSRDCEPEMLPVLTHGIIEIVDSLRRLNVI